MTSRPVNLIVIHCSASPDYQDIGYKEIKDWHVKGNKWSDIGYHYVVRRNGEIEAGRPLETAGAHANGVNANSVGICWVGTTSPSPEQYESLVGIINFVRGKYNIPIEKVLGHREAVKTSKTCPNLDMDKLRAELIFIKPVPKVR
jgi:N-acetylmuramoyl-L-alanine amidase